jgi:alanine-synthesizing transaminase
MARFSERTGWDLRTTKYAQAVNLLRSGGRDFIDLTASNPTVCGFEYDATGILQALSRAENLNYDPDARGLSVARQAVSQYYAEIAARLIPLEQIFLTTGTSEAYSYIFRLHCDPGSEVLITQPSYPLFEYLADLDDVRLVSYPLFYDHGWHIDLAALESRITSRTRAIAIVHPNNPTGHFTSAREREALERICQDHRLALIVDEVFFDYVLNPAGDEIAYVSFASGEHPALTYVLSGLSKVAGLPQMKAAWIAAFGPEALLRSATARLEVIADTFLSMNAPVQHALPYFLGARSGIQQQILARVRENLDALDRQLENAAAISRLEVQGGWYAIVRVPSLCSGEELALRLIREQQVVVHPGYFYGMSGEGWIVVSLLTPRDKFAEGMARLIRFFDGK